MLVTKDKIYCANAGDSRAILVRKSINGVPVVVELSSDHKPQNYNEFRRITQARHKVINNRVDGDLALSRALGDFEFKDAKEKSAKDQAVTAKPEIKVVTRTQDDWFILNACDGIWDCLSNEECAR